MTLKRGRQRSNLSGICIRFKRVAWKRMPKFIPPRTSGVAHECFLLYCHLQAVPFCVLKEILKRNTDFITHESENAEIKMAIQKRIAKS